MSAPLKSASGPMEIESWVHNHEVAGLDEAGRGPLAGGLSAAAVILGAAFPNQYRVQLTDSKRLTARKRQYLFSAIQEHAFDWSIGWCESSEVDRLNPLQASIEAMCRAVKALSSVPQALLVDGNYWSNRFKLPGAALPRGDQYVPQISAASILAKVYRDQKLLNLDHLAPSYGFSRHMGYGTRSHFLALQRFGVTPWHRMSYAPVLAVAQQQRFLPLRGGWAQGQSIDAMWLHHTPQLASVLVGS